MIILMMETSQEVKTLNLDVNRCMICLKAFDGKNNVSIIKCFGEKRHHRYGDGPQSKIFSKICKL